MNAPTSPVTLGGLHDALLLDLDGTLIRGIAPVPGAADALDRSGLSLVYVTNNASRSPADTAAHLTGMGFRASAEDVMTSAQAAVAMLADHVSPGARVLVVGHDSFRALASDAGYRVVLSADDEPEAVLQGLSRELTWGDLAEGCLAIRAGAVWVASNTDATLPTERGLLPGNGSLVAAMRTATDREPVVAGKPAAGVFRAAADVVDSSRPLVVGDRLDTDIEGAVAAGMPSLMVLTGVHGPADLLPAAPGSRPTHLAYDLEGLFEEESQVNILEAPRLDGAVTGTTFVPDGLPESLTGLHLVRSVLATAWDLGASGIATTRSGARSRLAEAGFVVG